MPSTTPLVDVISCLDSYNNSHIKASSSLKSTIWNISIARRQKGRLGVGYTYSASDVREELRAHVRLDGGGGHEPLEAQEEPPLDHDEDDGIDATKTSANSGEGSEEQGVGGGDGAFVIRFGPSTTGRTCGGIGGDTNDTMLGSSDGLGLRQRKGKESKTVEKGWTESCYEDELEEKLRNVDPLELFGGLPPKELKIAQKKAKESLEHYVTAANKVREILSIMKTK